MSSTTCRAATAAPEQSRHIMIEYIVDTDTDVDVEYVVETDMAIMSDGVVEDTEVDVDVECVVDTVGDVTPFRLGRTLHAGASARRAGVRRPAADRAICPPDRVIFPRVLQGLCALVCCGSCGVCAQRSTDVAVAHAACLKAEASWTPHALTRPSLAGRVGATFPRRGQCIDVRAQLVGRCATGSGGGGGFSSRSTLGWPGFSARNIAARPAHHAVATIC